MGTTGFGPVRKPPRRYETRPGNTGSEEAVGIGQRPRLKSGIRKMKRQRPARSGGFLSLIVTIGAVFLSSGCDSADPGQVHHPSFSRTDSAGITILTTPAEDALASLGWAVDSVPDVVIGSGEVESDQLYRVQGVQGFDDGRMVVVDGGSRQLRFFDAQGRLTGRVGRKGEGPGEFEDPILVELIGLDSLLVWDRYLRRFQYFSEDGRFSRTLVLTDRWPAGGRPPQGAVGGRMLVDERESSWLVPAPQQTRGPKETGVNLMWYDPASGSRVPIAAYTVTRDFIFIGPGRPPILDHIPFTVFPAAAVTASGGFLTDGKSFEIRDYDFTGELRRILRINLPGRPVSEAMAEEWLESESSGQPPGTSVRDQILRSMPLPDTLPAFESLLTDEMGFVWAKIYDWDTDNPQRWVVFDHEGPALGTIETPPGLEVGWVGPDAIIGVCKDEFDVEHVCRYRLTRR